MLKKIIILILTFLDLHFIRDKDFESFISYGIRDEDNH